MGMNKRDKFENIWDYNEKWRYIFIIMGIASLIFVGLLYHNGYLEKSFVDSKARFDKDDSINEKSWFFHNEKKPNNCNVWACGFTSYNPEIKEEICVCY